jgi:hypothetical protein
MLNKSFEQMLSASKSDSQELHHNADRHFSHNFQYVTFLLYLISGASETFVSAI